MNHIPGPNKPGHWGLLMGHCCSSPGVSAQLLQFEVVQAHCFHRCCSDLQSPPGPAAACEGHSHKSKTKLGCFSAFCNNQPVLLILIHRKDSTEHNTGLCPCKCPCFISSDCYMEYPHLVLAQSTRPEWLQPLITLLWEVHGAPHLGCSSFS